MILLRYCIIILLFSILELNAQVTGNQPIQLVWADSLLGTRGINNNIKEFSGKVEFRQGDVVVKCDRAVHFADEDRIELYGNVHINQKTLDLYTSQGSYNGKTKIAESNTKIKIIDNKTTLTAERGNYSTAKRIAKFDGDVSIEDDSVKIISDRLVWYKSDRSTFATGNVFISGKYSNSHLSGDTINHFPERGINEAMGKPKLFQLDTAAYDDDSEEYIIDTLTVSADYMLSRKGSMNELYKFISNVQIRKNNIASISDSAFYDNRNGTVELIGKPIVWYDSTRLFADSIHIDMPGMKLNQLIAKGDAFAATRDDTSKIDRISQISGNIITIHFENDSIRTINSYSNAKSLYFVKSDSLSQGAQRSSCDTLNVYFIEGKPDNILWLGGVNGDFFPDFMIPDPKQIYLPGFRWSDALPPKINLVRRK
jgi:lipopolysaccharide export system protein LptA